MFIRTVLKRNKSRSKLYPCQQLVESTRTEKGVRQHLLLSLGSLTLPQEQWPRLVRCIESIIQNQLTLFDETPEIEKLATKIAQQFIEKHAIELDAGDIIVQKRFLVEKNDNFNSIVKKNYELAPVAMLEALDKLEKGERDFIKNDESLATYNSTPGLKEAWRYRRGRGNIGIYDL